MKNSDIACLAGVDAMTVVLLVGAPYEHPKKLPRTRKGVVHTVNANLLERVHALEQQGLLEIEEEQGLYRCTEQGERVRLAFLSMVPS